MWSFYCPLWRTDPGPCTTWPCIHTPTSPAESHIPLFSQVPGQRTCVGLRVSCKPLTLQGSGHYSPSPLAGPLVLWGFTVKNWTNKARVYTVKKKRDNNSTTQIYIYIYIHTHTHKHIYLTSDLLLYKNIFLFTKLTPILNMNMQLCIMFFHA